MRMKQIALIAAIALPSVAILSCNSVARESGSVELVVAGTQAINQIDLQAGAAGCATSLGTVIMDIQVQKNEPATGLNIEGGAGTPLSTRRAQTKLMVRDGGTSVIAGIYQVKENNSQGRMPFLHQIPILGALFRERNYNAEHDELLIFITPRIVRAS